MIRAGRRLAFSLTGLVLRPRRCELHVEGTVHLVHPRSLNRRRLRRLLRVASVVIPTIVPADRSEVLARYRLHCLADLLPAVRRIELDSMDAVLVWARAVVHVHLALAQEEAGIFVDVSQARDLRPVRWTRAGADRVVRRVDLEAVGGEVQPTA